MSLSDPIGDMLARIKNAQVRNHNKVSLPSSKFKAKIADVLKSEGYIIDYKINDEKKPSIEINLKYNSGNPVINTIERISKPGRRIFSSASSLPKITRSLVRPSRLAILLASVRSICKAFGCNLPQQLKAKT